MKKYEIVNGKWIHKTIERKDGIKDESAIRISAIKSLYVDNEGELMVAFSNVYAEHKIILYASGGVKMTLYYFASEDEQFEKDLLELKELIYNS